MNMDMTMSLGWLGMFIGLLGFSAFWGWLMDTLQEDIFDRHKKVERETLENKLAVDEKALGKNHPSVATTLYELAIIYRSQRNYTQAEPLYKRALAIRENALGLDHPDVATILNHLAGIYGNQGQDTLAEQLYTRAEKINKNVKKIGPN